MAGEVITELTDVRRLNLLIELLSEFASVLTLDALITSLGARVPFLVSFGRCVLLLGDDIDHPSRVAVVRRHGVPTSSNVRELSALEVALATRTLETTLPALDHLRQPKVACYPLTSLGRPLGVLILTSDREPYTMADLRIVQLLTDSCGGVVARFQMAAAVQAMADERGLALANERRSHADAIAANCAKDEFLATLSHEMRTPLNAILGWVQTLQDTTAEGARLVHGLSAIQRSANNQRRLIEDLLDMSRIVSGTFRLEIAVVDLRTIIADALVAIGPAAEAKRLVIESAIEGDTLTRGDADRLRQVIWNLLSNAVKFTPLDGAITVRATRTETCISIAVTDTGVGIAPELLPHVFDRFRQGDPSTNRSYSGMGLGLSIVRNIAELHGGTVMAASPGKNRGTTITMVLPVALTSDGAAANPIDACAAR